MLQKEQRTKIWQSMMEPTRFGILRYKAGFQPAYLDPRENPVNYAVIGL